MKPETANRTAVEWLEYEFVKLESTVGVHSSMYHLIEEAKVKEKLQISEAYYNAFINAVEGIELDFEQYYNETFNTKEK